MANADQKRHVKRAVAIMGSQQRLAAALGCSQQLISALATGERELTLKRAVDIEVVTNGVVTRRDFWPAIFNS